MSDSNESTWLLLLHHLPPRPDYFRVRVRRQLDKIGALGIKNAAYVLPFSETALQEFEDLAAGIRRDGGDAMVVRAAFVSGMTSDELRHRFREQSDLAYGSFIAAARALRGDVRPVDLARLDLQLSRIRSRDTFGASGRQAAEAALQELRRQTEVTAAVSRIPGRPLGATWITQRDVSVNGIAAAWLIVRFIDRAARFRFVARGYRRAPGDLAFGLPESPYNGIEPLITQFGLGADPALARLAEMIRDQGAAAASYPETPGLRALFEGVITRYSSDAERIEHGRRLLDQLYTHFTRLTV